MKNLQLLGVGLVIIGSFLPLVKIPLIGNWNYWNIEPILASTIWILSILGYFFIQKNKLKASRIIAIFMLSIFVFTIIAVQFKSLDFFSFLPFKSWQSAFAGMVKFSWGWFFEFVGAVLILLPRKEIKIESEF